MTPAGVGEGPVRSFELPQELADTQRKAVRLEWITLAYLVSAVVLLFFTLRQSQAMKAAWIEDMLSLLPPAAFLIASRMRASRSGFRDSWIPPTVRIAHRISWTWSRA